MVVDVDGWGNMRKSLMEAVGFEPHKFHNRSPQNLRRSSSLNSLQSLCSTSLSSTSSDERELSPEFLCDVHDRPILPEVPEEDTDEDWRMFGWLLDASEANYPIASATCNLERKMSCPALFSPLPPLEVDVSTDAWARHSASPALSLTGGEPHDSDLLTVKYPLPHTSRPWWRNLPSCDDESDVESSKSSRKRTAGSSFGSDTETDCSDEEDFEERRVTRSMAHYLELKRSRKTGAEWPQEPESQESETKMEVMDASESRSSSTVASTPIMPEVKQEAALDSEEEYQNLPTSEFTSSRSPVRTSARQAPKTKRLSPGLEVSPSKSLVHSICVNGVSVISPIDVKEIRKSKPGRPSNKEKRKMQRHIDAQRKKLIKSGISQEGAIDFDVNACHCVCRQPYDAKKFYLACNRCKCWFHGKCIGLTEKKARKLKEWYCAECVPRSVKQKRMKKPISDDNTAEADEEKGLFCVCKQPYDSQKDYIGCDRCNDWFHFECVGVSAEMSKTMSEYLCPTCSGHTAMITEEEQEAICEAVQAMANDPDSGLFDKTSEEGKDFKQMVNDDVSLDEIYYKAFNKGYDCLREFVDEVSYIHAIVVSNSPPESQMCEVIKRLTTKASDILVQRLPDHEALSH